MGSRDFEASQSQPSGAPKSAATHTPGPWSIPHFAEPEAGCECRYVLTDTCMGAICSVHVSGEGYWLDTGDNPKFAEACANARLIASAPDLLATLIDARAQLEQYELDLTGETYNDVEINAAIAKATGQGEVS